MIIIIDGYNVLKQQEHGTFIEDSVRLALAHRLQRYARQKKHDIMLVFDGGPSPWPTQELKGAVQIVYAGNGKSADEFITHYVTDHKQKDFMLVSSDRALARSLAPFEVPVVDAIDFMQLVRQSEKYPPHQKKQNGQLIKTTSKIDAVLDELMQEASKHIQYKEEDENLDTACTQSSANRHKPSKQERKLQKKLTKL